MAYSRPVGAGASDFQNAKEFEEKVGEWLGDWKVSNLDSTERLDWWVPGFYVDVKEKRQKLSSRWHLIDSPEQDMFVIDELSVRKAVKHYPHAYFLIRDVPCDRFFLARVDEMFSAERGRLNRTGKTGHQKGKWVVDLQNFRQLVNPELQLRPTIMHDLTSMPWKASNCLTMLELPEA